jgi:hypothetical protein|tara:strand:+ start:828 stop:1019 length:192 start_codon:yes stop_codon:yes gene_type:complete
MTYGKKGDPIKLPGKNNDYIIGGRIKKGSPTNFYAKADEREGDLEYEIYVSPHNEEGTTNDIV